MQQILATSLLVIIFMFTSLSPAHASGNAPRIYLPLVHTVGSAFELPIGEVADDDPTHQFFIDPAPSVTRLRRWDESGGEFQCDTDGVLEVHVFGAGGDGNRLDNVLVQVTPLETVPQQDREIKATGHSSNESGVVRFNISGKTEVRVLADSDGKTVQSAAMIVSTNPGELSGQRLIDGGYCTDVGSCAEFAAANRCNGNLYWNVVFKKRGS